MPLTSRPAPPNTADSTAPGGPASLATAKHLLAQTHRCLDRLWNEFQQIGAARAADERQTPVAADGSVGAVGRDRPTALVQGHLMRLHDFHRDRVVSPALAQNGVFEPLETELVKSAIRPGDVVLDVGANIGYYTLLFARLAGANGMVYAFEPDPANFALLRENVERNGYRNVALIQKAVTDRPGIGRLYLSDTNPGDHRFYPSGDDRPAVAVEAVTLDQVFERHQGLFNFVKFDIQGSEAAALEGMRGLLGRHDRLTLVTEFWPFGLARAGVSPADYLAQLLELGFELFEIDEAQNRIVPAAVAALLRTYLPEKENFTNLLCLKARGSCPVGGWPPALGSVDREIERQRERQRLVWAQAGDLRGYEKQVFSQNGEDGILEEILRRVGAPDTYFVELGAETGAEGNCVLLARERGWQGLFIEADQGKYVELAARYREHPGVRTVAGRVTSSNIEELLAANEVPPEFGLLSIDIGGNDYWVWSAMRRWRPRVVVIEYNAAFPPPRRWVMKENPDHAWDGTSYYGASLTSLVRLGREKNYVLVGTNSTGVNAFFVRADLAQPRRFLDPALHYHYSPPTFGAQGAGHPPGQGEFLEL